MIRAGFLLRTQRARREGVDRVTAEIEHLRMRPDATETIGILPELGALAGEIVGDLFLEKLGLGAAFHRPVIPRDVQRGEIHEGRWAEFESAHFVAGGARASVVPWSDDQIVISRGPGGLQVTPIVLERAALISVVVSRDREHGDPNP